MQEEECRDKSNQKLRQCSPDNRRANLVCLKTMNRQCLRNEDDCCKQTKPEESQTNSKHDCVPLPKIRQIDQRVGAAQAPDERSQQENHGAEKQTVEEAGPPPVETLSLVKSGKQQRESGAGVEESGKTGRRARALSWRRRGNSPVNAQNHEGRDEGRIPEHPMKREMVAIPPVERRRDINRSVY
jgi:hypothetical protein